jgi:hypothetical protein
MSFSSSSGSAVPGFTLKKFESQNEVEEKKQKRQEEWEKVRKPDDPEGKIVTKQYQINMQ